MTGPNDSLGEGRPLRDRRGATALALGQSVMDLAPYMVVEPFVTSRDVLDVEPAHERGIDRLAVVGRARARRASWNGERIDAPDRSFDVALCLRWMAGPAEEPRSRNAMLDELRRVLRPDGFCVVRVAAPARGAEASRGERTRGELERWLRGWFAEVDVVAQVPFFGFTFTAPGAADVAVNEDLLPAEGAPMFHLAFCANGGERPYALTESLIVPVTYPDGIPPSREEVGTLAARIAELTRERDALRERLMSAEDQRERLERAAVGLRRDAERLLHQLSEQAEALEVASLEREAQRRSEAVSGADASADDEPLIVDEQPLEPT
jgi:SAM-dependent methyltransferase